MDTTQLAKRHSVLLKATRTLSDLEKEMQRLGVSARHLQVTEVKPGLHERAEGIRIRPIYLTSWRREPVRLFGLWSLPGTDMVSDKFVKLPLARLNIPPEANRRYEMIGNIVEIEESAVFLSTRLADSHLALILAVRIAAQWLEVYRWSASWIELGISRLEVCQV